VFTDGSVHPDSSELAYSLRALSVPKAFASQA